jgi:L-malate glycosyltransferase
MPVELETRFGRLRCIRATLEFVRRERVRVVYLADRPSWHPVYLLLRLAGVRRVIVHDHTSGARTVPRGAKRLLKLTMVRLLRSMLADEVIGVSDYVARRKVEVDLVPAERVRRIWNALDIPPANRDAPFSLRRATGLPDNARVIACACRASRVKGVEHLLRAFDLLDDDAKLVYFGEGPDLARLETIRARLRREQDVVFAGYRADAAELIEGADVCVVPSVWEEAFGLSALEPMARGVPVIATRVGGIPEIVLEGETGLLVSPADEQELATALRRLLRDPRERARMGENGRKRAIGEFAIEHEIDQLETLVGAGFRGQLVTHQ